MGKYISEQINARKTMSDSDKHILAGVRFHEPMSEHTSWKVGGVAKCYFAPNSKEELAVFLAQLEESETLLWLGLGSNVLIRDDGFNGTVISTTKLSSEIVIQDDFTVRVDAGVPCPKFARHCAKHSLQGMEFFAGIPGTIGGALAMNAGAFGGETWDVVKTVTTIDRKGNIITRTPEEYEISYRTVKAKQEEWFISAIFQLSEGNKETSQEKIKRLLAKRRDTQPMGIPSCGSVFRNPENDYAARLIEACGLKGEVIGGACISSKHANFILNTGGATANDIERLIELARESVKQKFGIDLIHEVRIIGKAIDRMNK